MALQIPLVHRLRSYWHQLYSRTFTDLQLATFLSETFESELNGAQIDGLRFYVKKNIVTIRGTLYRELDHEMVIKITSRIVGLKAIVDQIQVVKDVNKEEPCARILLLLNDRLETRRLIPA